MSNDYKGSIHHKGFYTIFHDDYTDLLHLEQAPATILDLLEVAHDANLRHHTRTEQRGRRKSDHPLYRRIEDVPEELRWFDLSLDEMHKRCRRLYCQTTLQESIPHVELAGYIKTRFVRFDKDGKITRVYPCVGHRWEERTKRVKHRDQDDEERVIRRLVADYDWQGENPRKVVQGTTKQYFVCVDAINEAIEHGIPDGPRGPYDPNDDDDSRYDGDDDEPGESGAETEESVTKTGNSPSENMHESDNQLPKLVSPVAKTGNSVAKTGNSHARSNTHNTHKNLSKKSSKETASPLPTHTDSFPELPEHGPLTPANIYQIMAHYFGLPKPSDEDRWNEAAISIQEQLDKAGLFEVGSLFVTGHSAREALIRTILYMRLADKFWSTRPGALSAWKVAEYFTEHLGKSIGWLPPEEYMADLDEPEEEPAMIKRAINQVNTPTPQETRPAPPQPITIEVEPTPEEQECCNLGIATRYAPALRRLAAHGYYVGRYPAPDNRYALLDAGDCVVLGHEYIEPRDLWMLAASVGRRAS